MKPYTEQFDGFKVVTVEYPKYTRITGYIEDLDVIAISNEIYGKWHVGTSICLPSDVKRAATIIACMSEVINRLKDYQ